MAPHFDVAVAKHRNRWQFYPCAGEPP